MNAPAERVLRALRAPDTLAQASPADWTKLLADARRLNLLGALSLRCAESGMVAPPAVHRHLEGARQVAERQRLSVHWEVAQLAETLGPLGVPVLLLKGAAYVMGDHALGRGRMFGDIDILVPREALGSVESQLMLAGWVGAKIDAYDQHYYRTWMHELPPMTHVHRGTVLDVHHTIMPPTARHAPDPAGIFARARPLTAWPAIRVPSPEDLLIHSLTHLMHEGELRNGVRDLHDVDEMACVFGVAPGFWERLTAVALANDLAVPVALGLALARLVFGATVPETVLAQLHPGPLPRWLWPIYRRALDPSTCTAAAFGIASGLVYVRAHALRMPPVLLARHLAIKAWRGLKPVPATTPRPEP